jgi:heme/copper-type cytochrome/quinol oxidase subunit 2
MQMLFSLLLAQATEPARVSGGVIILTAIAVAIPVIAVFVYLRIDYRRHKKPLTLIDPSVKYTFWHHVRVVTIPLFSYRIRFMIQKKDS